jgi:hypothetical protein
MDPGAVRSGLKTNLLTVAGLPRAYDTEPSNPVPPCAVCWPRQPFIERDSMRKGYFTQNWTVIVIVAAFDNDKGQNQLDSFLVTSGTGSVWTGIEVDKTLAGAAEDVSVVEIRRYDGNYIVHGNQFFAAEIDVMVLGKG